MDISETKDQNPDPTKPPKSKKALKWVGILGSVLLLLLVSLALLLTYFFPSALVRNELEVRGSEILQGTIHIQSLSFNLLTGLELQEVEFLKHEKPLLRLERLNLDYSLLGLLKRQLRINEVLIDRAYVSLNLPELAAATEPVKEEPAPPPPPSEEPAIPALPVSVDLETLEIRDSNINLVVSPTLAVDLTDLNLDVSGSVTEEAAELDGSLNVADIAVDLDEKHIQLPLGVNFSLLANLPEQNIDLRRFSLESNPAVQFTLSGKVNAFLTKKEMDLTLHDVALDLEKVLLLGKDFVPPDLANIRLAGTLSPQIHVLGLLPESGFQGKVNLIINGKGLEADLPPFSTSLRATDVIIKASDLSIKDNLPEFAVLQISLSNRSAKYQDYVVQGLHLDLSSEYLAAGPLSGNLRMTGDSTIPPTGPLESLTLPFDVQLEADGNYKGQDLILKDLAVKLGDLLNLHAHGEVHPQQSPLQGLNVSLATRLEPHIGNLLHLIPQDLLKGVTVRKGAGPDIIVVNATGALNPDFLPQWAKLSTSVKLASLIAALDALPAGGTLDHMNVLVSTEYNAQSGRVQGTVGTALKLSDLYHGNALTIDQSALELTSAIDGTVNSAFEPTNLRSQDELEIKIGDIVYNDPTLKAVIDHVTVSSKTKENIFNGDYVIDALQITSDPLMELTVNGSYRMKDQQFTVETNIPFVNVREVLRSLSGEVVEGLNEMNPQGIVTLSLKSSGRVPQQNDIDQLALPVDLTANIAIKDVEGAFAQHRIRGAGGTISATFVPGHHPVAKLNTDFKLNEVQLAPGLPLKTVSQAIAKVNISARNFDEIHFDQIYLGMKGADLALKGTVTGVKDYLTGKPELGAILGKLFAQVTTKASVNLEPFQDLLEPAGLTGSGMTQVGISVLKKEEGPLDLRLKLGTKKVNLNQDSTKVNNINGGLSLRKRLLWNTDFQKKPPTQQFNPTDVLSRLQSFTGKRKNLTIDQIDLGFLTLSNFSTNILFDRNAFKIQNLVMNLLGGGLGGNVVLTTGKAFGVSARFEGAQLDLNQLLDENFKIAGDSLVDSTIDISIFFEEDTGALDLSRTEMNLFITHIGQEALDRLLVFLDPEGSNPTLVSARSQVKLANPSRVTIQMARGMMGLDIRFSEGLLSSFKIDRIPVGRIKNLQTVTQGLPNWEMVAQTMAMVGAETYGVDQSGNIIIQ